MPPFEGFSAGKARLTRVPAQFFTDLLGEIDNLAELKVCLYVIWYLDQQEGDIRFLSHADIAADRRFMKGMGATRVSAEEALNDGLERAVGRGILLRALAENADPSSALYFLNTARGRAALQAYGKGEWSPQGVARAPLALEMERPNIFRLYEENIGPLTPMIAEMLRDAEQQYPMRWIEEAVRIAVENNARSWRYIDKILQSWQRREPDGANRRDPEKDRRRYLEGEFSEFIEH